jgi:hypothetical protein
MNQTLTTVDGLAVQMEAIAGKARFASFDYTAKESGERARHTVILSADYINCLERSALELSLIGIASFAAENKLPVAAVAAAHAELTESIQESIREQKAGRQNSAYTKKGMYKPLCNGIHSFVDGTLEIKGISQSKVVQVPGVFKPVNSSPKTLAKNALRRALPLGKFRTFCLDIGNMHTVKLNGETIEFA